MSWMWQSWPRPYHISSQLSSSEIQPFMKNILYIRVLNFGEVSLHAEGNLRPIWVASLSSTTHYHRVGFLCRPMWSAACIRREVQLELQNVRPLLLTWSCSETSGRISTKFCICNQENSIFTLIHVKHIFHARQIKLCEVYKARHIV